MGKAGQVKDTGKKIKLFLFIVVEPYCQEYRRAAAFKNLPLEALNKRSSPMYLIKIEPKHIDFLHAAFREQGFFARQALDV